MGQYGQEFILAPVCLAQLAVESCVFDGRRRAVGQVLGHRQILAFVTPARLRSHERDDAERLATHGQWDTHIRFQTQFT